MYLDYLKNNFILCSFFGLIAVILGFIDSRRNKEKYSMKNYAKIFAVVTICCYIVLYMKSNNILGVSNEIDTTLYSSRSAPWSMGGGGSGVSQSQSGAAGVNLENYNSVNIGEPNF
jgi:hypothetical protein